MVERQQGAAHTSDHLGDEPVLKAGDAEREAEHCHVQVLIAQTTC